MAAILFVVCCVLFVLLLIIMENKEQIYTALEGNIVKWYIELKYESPLLALRIVLCLSLIHI